MFILAEHQWVADYNQQSLGPGHRHVETFGVAQESEFELRVECEVLRLTTYGGNDDDL